MPLFSPSARPTTEAHTHTHTYVSGALLWSTDIAGFWSNTQGVPPKVKSCLSDWRKSVEQRWNQRVRRKTQKQKSLESAEKQQSDSERDLEILSLCTWTFSSVLKHVDSLTMPLFSLSCYIVWLSWFGFRNTQTLYTVIKYVGWSLQSFLLSSF